MQYHKIVFMFLIKLYALCFRFAYWKVDQIEGFFESWKKIADIEKIFGHIINENAVQGLDYFFLCQEYLFPFKGACAASEVIMLQDRLLKA